MPRQFGVRNVWSAARDEMLDFLTERESRQRQEEDRARVLKQQEVENAQRDRQLKVSEGQLSSIEKDRAERQRDQDKAQTIAEQQRVRLGELLDAYDAATTEDQKYDIGVKIINSGGKLPPAKRTPPRDPVADHRAKRLFDIANPLPTKEPASHRDDPDLPRGVTDWIDSIAQRGGVSIAQAREELSKGWKQQKSAHPRASLGKAAAYLNSVFPASDAPFDQTPRTSLAGAPRSDAPQAALPGAESKSDVTPAPAPAEVKFNVKAAEAGPAATVNPNAAADGPVPPEVENVLRNLPVGKQVPLSDGSVWGRMPNGQLRKLN